MAEAAAPTALRSQKYNIGQYRGVLDTVEHVKAKIDRERNEAATREKGLRVTLADKIAKGSQVQKELSIQLRCAGRSYSQILDANRELGDQMRVEIEQREDVIGDLRKEIRDKEKIILVADKPWKEALAKQELKLLKLQENNADLKVKVKEESMKVPPIHVMYKQKLKEKQEAFDSVVVETNALRELAGEVLEEHEKEVEGIKAPFLHQITNMQREFRDERVVAEDTIATLKREIKKIENTKVGLQKELDKVDHTPYERKIDTLNDAFARLVKDFEIKTQLNSENVFKMREGFESVIEGLDKRIQKNEAEHQRLLKPYQDKIEHKQMIVDKLELRIQDMKDSEGAVRAKDKKIQDDLNKELVVCKQAVDMYLKEITVAKKELAAAMEALEGDDGPWKKIRAYERRMLEVTEKCAGLIKAKDTEVADKNAIIGRLQAKLRDDSERFVTFAEMWDGRIQEKDKGFNKAVAELAFAEGQIIEERKRVVIEQKKVIDRDMQIVTLKQEHWEELRTRERYRQELEVVIEEMEYAAEAERGSNEGIRVKLECELDEFRAVAAVRVADLRIEMERRDRLKEEVDIKLLEVQGSWDKARLDWEEKERELGIYVRSRDRNILALKNELEFLNDNWEIKYARLVNLYEKLQKKYEETIGANGVHEAMNRAKALKAENEKLHTMIHELREVIEKQKKVIRGLQLDYDQLMKETADVIAEKERGIATMAGDYVILENKYRDEQTLRARLLKQKDAERFAMAESFAARIEQLEQIMDAMRFNDRQELLDKIKLWKKNYERVCVERDEVEEYYKDLVERKELQLQKMVNNNNDEMENTEKALLAGIENVRLAELKWKRSHFTDQERIMHLEQELRDMTVARDKAQFQATRQLAINGAIVEDPLIAEQKERIKELEGNILKVEEGIAGIVAENVKLSQVTEHVEALQEDVHGQYRPIIQAKDDLIKSMEREHEELKDILKKEMKRAQDTCADIEEQVKRFPDPFIDEIAEMKDKYAQMQAGMQKIQLENLFLSEKAEKTEKAMEKEIVSLEKSLSLAKHLLHEVTTLEALKHLHTSEAQKAEELGLDF